MKKYSELKKLQLGLSKLILIQQENKYVKTFVFASDLLKNEHEFIALKKFFEQKHIYSDLKPLDKNFYELEFENGASICLNQKPLYTFVKNFSEISADYNLFMQDKILPKSIELKR